MSGDMRDRLLERWDDVRVLLAALRAGSFTAAAAQLATDQSTVSRRIALLEQTFGVALFERSGRKPLPTESALALRDAAERIESEVGRFADEAVGLRNQAIEGRVRVATTEELAVSVVVPKVLPALRREHPKLFVDLVTSYRAADLVGREADIAIRFFQTERGDLVGRRVTRWATALLSSRRLARRVKNVPLRDLNWISVELAGITTPESSWLERHMAHPPVMVCSSYQVQIAAIRAGLGVGIGPQLFADLDRAFAAIGRAGDLPMLDVHLVTRRAIRDLPRVATVMSALASALDALG
jgi:DNA-binding transcriptional LysR family regulator